MNLSIEERKLLIVERLAEMVDEGIILQIENLLQPRVDIWDELNDAEKEVIRKGAKDLDEGRRIPFQALLDQYRKAQ
ncbi:MAG: hypothetical protein KDD02_00860 [Phaeodactylibacter sp.]|nr:hypothetical protein [Phaeodactylibacter sp.]MCB9303911.1 hypothetical protein [Lewinellaceae bacterium]